MPALNEKTYHLINQYLQGELKGRALDEFKVKLKDEAFAKHVAEQSAIINALKEVRKEELKALFKQENKTKYIQNQWGNKWTYASAAIVVLFVSAFFIVRFVIPQQSEQLATEEAVPAQSDSITEEAEETQVDTQMLAIEDGLPPNPMELVEDVQEDVPDSLPQIEVVEEEIDDLDGIAESFDEEETGDALPVEEDLFVKKDEHIASKEYTVRRYSPTFIEQTRASKADDSSAELLDTQEVEAGAISKDIEPKTVKLSVEYWSSPVNFKGYKYSKNGLQLFEIDPTESLSFKFLDQRLYLKLGKNFYFLEKNNEFNKFVAVSNQTLLDVLNE